VLKNLTSRKVGAAAHRRHEKGESENHVRCPNESGRALQAKTECTTVVFYGRRNFERKTVQADAKKQHRTGRILSRERSLCETVKNHAKKLCLNYESPALTAELQAHKSQLFTKCSFRLTRKREAAASVEQQYGGSA
jgi:hypothetical protein